MTRKKWPTFCTQFLSVGLFLPWLVGVPWLLFHTPPVMGVLRCPWYKAMFWPMVMFYAAAFIWYLYSVRDLEPASKRGESKWLILGAVLLFSFGSPAFLTLPFYYFSNEIRSIETLVTDIDLDKSGRHRRCHTTINVAYDDSFFVFNDICVRRSFASGLKIGAPIVVKGYWNPLVGLYATSIQKKQ